MRREDQVFWDRLADMPWVEAEQECVSRREQLLLELAVLRSAKPNVSLPRDREAITAEETYMNGQLSLLNERIRYLRKVQERVRWVDACKAILDDDTYMAIKMHMERLEAEVRATCPPPPLPR